MKDNRKQRERERERERGKTTADADGGHEKGSAHRRLIASNRPIYDFMCTDAYIYRLSLVYLGLVCRAVVRWNFAGLWLDTIWVHMHGICRRVSTKAFSSMYMYTKQKVNAVEKGDYLFLNNNNKMWGMI